MNMRLSCLALVVFFLFSLCACAQKAVPETPVTVPPAAETQPETPEPTPAPAPAPEPEPEPETLRASFFAVGDNIIHTGIWRQANRNVGGSGNDCTMQSAYDFSPFYANIKPLVAAADIAFLNQETLCAANEDTAPSNYPAFNTPRACGDAMVELGFDVVSIANNHMMDMGARGLKNSIDYWNEKPEITLLGGYLSEADFNNIRVVEKNGLRIAMLAYAEDPNNSGLGTAVPLSNYMPYSSLGLFVPALNESVLRAQVAKAREMADFVLVSVHWGTENSYTLSPAQKHYASVMASLGVDVVLGTHPHVLQKIEWLQGGNASGKTLVIYSLGNLISLMNAMDSNMLGGCINFDFVKTGDATSIEDVVFTPTVSHCSNSYRDIRVCLLRDYTAADYADHYIHRYCNSSLSDLQAVVSAQIPAEFLKD